MVLRLSVQDSAEELSSLQRRLRESQAACAALEQDMRQYQQAGPELERQQAVLQAGMSTLPILTVHPSHAPCCGHTMCSWRVSLCLQQSMYLLLLLLLHIGHNQAVNRFVAVAFPYAAGTLSACCYCCCCCVCGQAQLRPDAEQASDNCMQLLTNGVACRGASLEGGQGRS